MLIDPFNGGTTVGLRTLAALLSTVGPVDVAASEHLSPMSNRAVLVRLLLNQATRAERSGDRRRALTLYERMTTIAPANGHGWWERARLELVHDDVQAARSSLSAMLEMTRDPATRAHIVEALDSLAGSEGGP